MLYLRPDPSSVAPPFLITTMFNTHDLKTAWRVFSKDRLFAAVNIIGLVLGISCCALILLLVRHEYTYDDFHVDADRMYRLTRTNADGQTTPLLPAQVAPRLVQEEPDIDAATRFMRVGRTLVGKGVDAAFFRDVYAADETFFDVFGFRAQGGELTNALDAPYRAVITSDVAQRMFGRLDVVGDVLTINAQQYTVGAVLEPIPARSHFQFEILVSLATPGAWSSMLENWNAISFYTYARVHSSDASRLTQAVSNMPEMSGATYGAQRVTDINVGSDFGVLEVGPTTQPLMLLLFIGIAVLVAVVAGMNYVNLSIAQAGRRAKEIAIRRYAGASQQSLFKQFILESMVVSAVAMIIAYGVVALALPVMSQVIDRTLDPSMMWGDPVVPLIFVGVFLAVGVVSGLYPAFKLSRMELAGRLKQRGLGRSTNQTTQRFLIVAQFAVAGILLFVTMAVQRQVDFMAENDLGFQVERLVEVRGEGLLGEFSAFESEIRSLGSVENVTRGRLPGVHGSTPVAGPGESLMQGTSANFTFVDKTFIEATGIRMASGQSFAGFGDEEVRDYVILNQAAASEILDGASPLDADVQLLDLVDGVPGERSLRVIGVVDDFHFQSMHDRIAPLLLRVDPSWPDQTQLLVRLREGQIAPGMQQVNEVWTSFSPSHPLNATFVADDFASYYDAERRLAHGFILFAVLLIAVACCGLFAISTYVGRERAKEVALRKAIGATTRQVLVLLSTSIVKNVAIALLLGMPLAYVIATHWMQNFAYSAGIGVSIPLLTILCMMGVALMTVSYHILRVTRTPPTEALRAD